MPHCIVEHSTQYNAARLIDCVHRGAVTSELFSIEGSDIKVRSIPYSHYKTGSVDIGFVHVTLRILPGRTAEQKSKLSGFVLDELKRVITHECSLSVEVVDIDGDSYAKVVV